jgi:hypothetical protein
MHAGVSCTIYAGALHSSGEEWITGHLLRPASAGPPVCAQLTAGISPGQQ